MTAAFLSLGSINADFQMRVPAEIGDIETQLAHDFLRLSGGKAANRALLARRFGHPAQLFGRVGDDELAVQALGGPRSEGVDLAGVGKVRDVSTAVSIIVVPPSAKKRIFLASNANACWDAAAVRAFEAAVGAADAASILTIDYETSPDVVATALEAARRRDIRVVIDPSPGDRVGHAAIVQCAAIAPNAEEIEALSGVAVSDGASAKRAAQDLAKQGAKLVCLKLADGGAMIVAADGSFLIPAPRVEAVDTTGAGDAFTAALAIALFEGRSLPDAACLAVASASMAVTMYGSQHDNLSPKHIEPLATRIRRTVRMA